VYDLCLSVANGPANDEPCGAVVLPVAQSADCVANVPLSWNFASASEGLATPNCGSYLGGDVWFKFTLDFKADILVKTLAGIGAAGITDGAMELYAADGCDNLSLLICADDETPQIYMPQITFYALPAGDYYLRFWDYSDAISGNIGGICVAAQPSISVLDNDNCLGATAFSDIPLDGSCATVEVETGQATGNADDATAPGFPDDDVWFKFTVPVGGQNLYFELNTFSGNNQQALCFYNACGDPNPFLNITDRLEGKLQGFVEGNEYYIRAYTFEKEVSSHFSICLRVLQPPSNDLCINALDFPAIPADGNLATVAVNSFTAISSIASCHDAETGDVWYRFTVPANTSSLVARIEMADGSDDVAGFELFEGNCNNLTSLGCFSNYFSSGRLRMDGLMPGQSYFLLTYKFDENSQVPYQLSLAIPPPPPVNDVCLGAIPFPTIPTDGSCASVVANTLGATEDTDDACFFSVDDGVWFSFVMPIGYTKLLAQRTILSGSPFDEIIIYSGSCNSLNSISCHSQGEILINDLVGGETYYLQAHSMFLDDTTAYEICLKLLPNTSLPNDDCGAPIPFPPIPVSGDWVTVQGNTLGGTPSGLPPCNGYGEDDVWHKFAVPMGYDRLLYALEKVNSFNGAGVNMEIYAGACADPQFIGCYSTDNTGHISGLQGGQAYLMRIYSTGDNDYAQYEVSLRVPPPLLNDGCANALAFPPLPTNGTCVSLQAHTVFAEGTQTPPCPGAQDDDVWFKFVAPSDRTVVHYDVEVLSGNSILRTQLYKGGDCSSLLLQECSQTIVQFDTEDFSLLEPNATYYIRVFSNDANVSTEFDLCLSAGPLPPPNDSCHHATPITDAMGNFSDPGLQTLAGATHSNQPLCAQIGQGNLPFDVWYTFTTDSDGGDATIEVDGLGDLFTFGYFQLGIQAFSGGCGDLSTLWCGPAQDYLNDKGSFTLYGLLPSTEYLFRVFPITNTGGYAARLFNISAHGTALSPTIGWEDPNEMASAHLAIGKIIPNPADHQATVIYHAPQAAEYRLTVFDLMGRPIITQFAQSQVGENRCQLELRGFPSGLYTIQLSNSFQQATAMRFVKR
jgi:large repetitive protein